MKENDKIIIKGARVHNLKNISLEIPKNKLVVFTGVSGSGKSSLAFDTIFAEYREDILSLCRLTPANFSLNGSVRTWMKSPGFLRLSP